jgi:putative ABC transport system ATP-binding protein
MPGRGTPVIELQGVTKVYGEGEGEVRALRGIDLAIWPGEFVAVMGPSGSGKSTCMNILGCLDTPTSGIYRFMGVPVGGMSADERALLRRNYLGFVFQGFNLLSRTTALENVELPLIYRHIPAAERRARARRALHEVGLAGRESHIPSQLSGGQQQRVAIARAIVTEPRVLFADEPTGNLDTATSIEIMKLLTSLNEQRGITIAMVTHEPDIAAWTRRIVRFRDGNIESDETMPPGGWPFAAGAQHHEEARCDLESQASIRESGRSGDSRCS